MKKIFCILISFFSLCALSGTEIQNGGGGLIVDGKVATFESAKVEVEQVSFLNFPSLLELSYEISKLSLEPKIKSKLISLLSPSKERKYYKINERNLSEEVILRIKNDYKDKIGIAEPGSEITIFAVTNIKTNTTMLMPDFFRLSILEKQVVLFHELMWLTGKVTNLDEMLDIEVKFQRMLEKRDLKSKFDFYFAFGTLFDEDYSGLLNSMLANELNSYAQLKGSHYEVKFHEIFSPDSLAALTHYIRNNHFNKGRGDISELVYTLEEDLSNNQDSFWYTKFALLNILFTKNYSSNFRELVELNQQFEVANNLSIDEIDQAILEVISNSSFKNLNESIFNGSLDFFSMEKGKSIGSFLPVKFIK